MQKFRTHVKKILDPLSKANKINLAADFNDLTKLDDDLFGNAYEYLMRHFATERGKSKGQFYTPSGVSRVIAKSLEKAKSDTTAYDPTCAPVRFC